MENFVKNFKLFTKNKKKLELCEKNEVEKEKRKEPKEKRKSQVKDLTWDNNIREFRLRLIILLYKYLVSRLIKDLKEKEETKERKNKKKENKEEKEIFGEIENFTQNVKSRELLIDFVRLRRRMKKPLTMISLKYNLRKLSKLSSNDHEMQLIVSQTLENGWRSFFETSELKNYRKKRKNDFSDFSFHIE